LSKGGNNSLNKTIVFVSTSVFSIVIDGTDFTGAVNLSIGNISCEGTPINAAFTCTG